MPSGSSINRGHLRAALSLLALLGWACNTTSTKGDAGEDAGDSGPTGPVGNFCKSVGGDCSSSATACCPTLTCVSGACQQSPAICAGYAEPCGNGLPDCCDPPDGGLLFCNTLNDAGLSLCLSPLPSQQTVPCNSDADCPAPYSCSNNTCGLIDTGMNCNNKSDKPADYRTPCQVGDECILTNNELSAIEMYGESSDPCQASGLVCVFTSSNGVCVQPAVAGAKVGSPDGPPFDPSVCSTKDQQCASYYTGADREAPVCGAFMIGAPDHCEESCTTGDDCDSIALDCIKGQCKPNYCYADGTSPTGSGTAAKYYSNLQTKYGGLTVSASDSVLFQPCTTGESFPTACLPQYDSLANGTTGECVRVGGDGSGSWGDPCDPNPYRNDLGGLCQFGTYCYLGTCMPWCDLGSTTTAACPTGTTCQPVPSGPLGSTALGSTHAIGVCAQDCDPYVDSTQNGCMPFPVDAGQPLLGCKLSGNASDTIPAPGNCVALVDKPIAVGDPCTSFGWLDPCVSGAECLQNADAGITFVCRQICDPDRSSNIAITAPDCPDNQTCVKMQTCGGAGGPCSHQGYCE